MRDPYKTLRSIGIILILWAAESRAQDIELVVQNGHYGSITSVGFAQDGGLLVSSGDDATAKVWKVETAKQLRTMRGEERGSMRMAVSPDRKHFATASWNSIRVWSLDGGKELLKIKADLRVSSIVFGPDDKTVITGHEDGTVRLWDMTTGNQRRTLTRFSEYVVVVLLAADGKSLVAVDGDSNLKVWGTSNFANTLNFKGALFLNSAALSHDGKILAGGSYSGVQLWDLASGKELRAPEKAEGPVFPLVFTKDGKTLIGGYTGGVAFWDLANGKIVRSIKSRVTSLALRRQPSGSRGCSRVGENLELVGIHGPDRP